MNSLAISETRIRDAILSKNLYYAASLPRSVECRQSGFFRNPKPIKETKILMVNGKIDDASHAHICEEYGEKMKLNGADIKAGSKPMRSKNKGIDAPAVAPIITKRKP